MNEGTPRHPRTVVVDDVVVDAQVVRVVVRVESVVPDIVSGTKRPTPRGRPSKLKELSAGTRKTKSGEKKRTPCFPPL